MIWIIIYCIGFVVTFYFQARYTDNEVFPVMLHSLLWWGFIPIISIIVIAEKLIDWIRE